MRFNVNTFGALLFVVSLALFLANSWGLSIYALDEAKNAECAWELMHGDGVTPTFNGELRTDKPPLHYYMMSLAYIKFGKTELAARFMGALAGALLIFFTFRYTYRYCKESVAYMTSLILLASIHLAIQYHMAVPDPYLILFVTLAVFKLVDFRAHKNRYHLWIAYAFMGLACLTKGPVGFVLPGLAVLVYLPFTGRFTFKRLFSFISVTGILILLAINLPWYIAVHLKTEGAWTEGFFLKHNVGRFSSEMEGHGGGPWRTWLFVILGMLPFSFFLFQAYAFIWKTKANFFVNYAVAMSLATIGFFSISGTKLPNYTVPAYPFLAVILAYYFNLFWEKKEEIRKIRIPAFIQIVLSIALVPGVYFGLQIDPALRDQKSAAFFLLPIPIGAIFSFYFLKQARFKSFFNSLAVPFILTSFLVFFVALPMIDRQNPVTKFEHMYVENHTVVAYKNFNPAFVFYHHSNIPEIESKEALEARLKTSKTEIRIISRKKYKEELEAIPGVKMLDAARDIFEKPTSAIYTYQPPG